MGFKEMVAADVAVFINLDEFAEEKCVIYDGENFRFAMVLQKNIDKDREQRRDDFAQGINLTTATAYMAEDAFGGKVPRQGRIISIEDGFALGEIFYQEYRIVQCDIEMGVIRLSLEAFGE